MILKKSLSIKIQNAITYAFKAMLKNSETQSKGLKMKTTNIIAILATIIGLLAFSSQNLSADIHYNADESVMYANAHVKVGCGKLACTEAWNTSKYPGTDKYNGGESGTNCIGFVSEAFIAGGVPEKKGAYKEEYGHSWRYKSQTWLSIRFFLKRIFPGSDVENGHYDNVIPEYTEWYDGAWADLEPEITTPDNAKKGDILLFNYPSTQFYFEHAVLVTSDAKNNDDGYSLTYTGHTSDVCNAIQTFDSSGEAVIDGGILKMKVLHFNNNVTRTNSETPPPCTYGLIYRLTKTMGFDYWYDFELHGKNDPDKKEYEGVLKKRNKTISRFFGIKKVKKDTKVYIILKTRGDDDSYLFLYHKDGNGKRIIDAENDDWGGNWGYNSIIYPFTLKKGVEYFLEATTYDKDSFAKMSIGIGKV